MNPEYSEKKNYALYEKQLKIIEKKIAGVMRNKKPASLYEPCNYILQGGGKRLRPFLVLISAKAVGAEFKSAYNGALAVELLHNFTLVHDDIMDNADKRRSRPTLHIKYDTNTAILAGDSLAAVAYHYLLKDCIDNDKRIMEIFTTGLIEVCEGQSLDKEFETKKNVSIKEYKIMIYKKTAALIEACCAIGGEIGKGSKKEIKSLREYGKNLGMAFQINDDLLDLIGDESEFGKSVGGDLAEGKKTYLFLRAMEKAKGKDKKELQKLVQNKGLENRIQKNKAKLQSEIKKYRKIYNDLGVFEDTKKEVLNYTKKALKALEEIKNREAQDSLIWLANVLLKRNK